MKKIVQSQLALMLRRFKHVLEKLIFSAIQLRKEKCGKLVVGLHPFHQVLCSGIIWLIFYTDIIKKSILDHARQAVAPYQSSPLGAPDPSFVMQLSDDVYTSSNLYAIQKFFDGPFQYDVYFDSGSVKQKFTCKWTFSLNFVDIF